ncbi:MAG: hypothetical protein ACJ768_12005 [Gaiellaceae bacterium]
MSVKGKRIGLVLSAAAAAAIVAVPLAKAAPVCNGNLQPFAQFGDSNTYFGFANNGFESGTAGWNLTGASVGAGNEPWFVNGPGSSSLSIGPGGTAVGPLVCAGRDVPSWRMFAHSNGANGSLHAQVVFYSVRGNITGALNVTNLDPSGYATWQPTAALPSGLPLPFTTYYEQLRLTSIARSGTWQVDDVFVDPWMSRNSG